MNGLRHTHWSEKAAIWLVIEAVYLSSFGPWQLASAVEVEKQQPTTATTQAESESEGVESVTEIQPDFAATQAEIDARVAQRVERFQMAQATTEPILNQTAAEMLTRAEAASESGNHVSAALTAFEVTKQYSGSAESMAAIRFLTNYTKRMQAGEFPQSLIDLFQASLPSFEQAASVDAQYVVVGFWMGAAQCARLNDKPNLVASFAQRALEDAWKFVEHNATSPFQIYVVSYLTAAANMLGEDNVNGVLAVLADRAGTADPSIFSCAAHSILARYHTLRLNRTGARAQWVGLMKDWEAINGAELLEDPSVPYECKSYLLMYVGLGQRSLGDHEGALASFDIAANALPNAGFPTESAALYGIRLRHQLEVLDSGDALETYADYLTRFPETILRADVMLDVADIHVSTGDYDLAYDIYEGLAQERPGSRAAKISETGMEHLVRQELSIMNAGEDVQVALAMACGPMALRELLAHQGVDTNVLELIRLAKTNGTGTTMSHLIAAAASKGVALDGVRAASLEELSVPFIAFVKGNHYLVVNNYDEQTVTVSDMGRLMEVRPRADFDIEWKGEALVAPGDYRLADALATEAMDLLTGGVDAPYCDDGYGGISDDCVPVPEDAITPESCPLSPASGASDCCTAEPGGQNTNNAPANDVKIDPWLLGPGLPVSGLHQSGQYIDAGIPGHVGNVYIQPFMMEMRIDRTDMVVKSRGTLEFDLTYTYANPRGGNLLWIDRCSDVSVNCGAEENETRCIERTYGLFDFNQPPPAWRSNYDFDIENEGDDVLSVGLHWSPYRKEYLKTGTQGGFDIYEPIEGDDGTHISSNGSIYSYTRNDGYVWGFNSSGILTSITDASGNSMSLSYSNGLLSQVTLPSSDGRTIEFTYGSDTKTVQLKQGSTVLREVQYVSGIDQFRGYTAVKYDGEEVVRYYYKRLYSDSGVGGSHPHEPSLCQEEPPNDPIYETNWIDEIKDAKGNSYFFDYNAAQSLAGPTYMEAPNIEITRSFDSSGLNTLDTTVATHNRTFKYKRDSNYRLTSREFYNSAGTGDWEKWTYAYSSGGWLTQVNSPGLTAGTTEVWGRLAYDTDGRILTVKRGPGSSAPTWTYTYTSGYEYPTKLTDPTGVETTWIYDSTNKTMLWKYKPPVARNSTNGFVFARNSYGEITSVTDPQGKVWEYDYDTWGNLDFAETPLSEAVEMEWNALGQLKKVWDPMDKRTEFEYITGTGCSTCGPPGLLKEVKRFYTSGGTEYHRLTTFDYDDNGSLEFVTDPGGETVAYIYDDRNQVTAITFPYGTGAAKTTSVAWKPFGTVESITDAESKTTVFGYDHVYRLNLINDPLTSPAGNTLLAYTRFGNLNTVTDSKGQTWTYTYNDKQWLTDITDGLTGSLSTGKNLHYALDAAGRVTQVSAGTGVGNGGTYPIAYDYEIGSTGRGVLERVDYGTSGGGGFAAFQYNHLGAVTSMDDAMKALFSMPELTYTYDDAGRLETLSDWNGTLSYDYNAAGAVTDFTDWEGNVTHYDYNDLHELTALSFLDGTANEETWSFAYTAVGQPDSYTHPNGMTTDYVYDGNGILTDILHKDGSTVKQGFSYDEYDDVYNIKKVTHEDGSYWTYGYDNRYRLTSAVRHNAGDTIQANYSYAYDAGDNMTSKTEPWVDDFSDGSTSGDWSTAGTWSASTKAAKNTSSASGAGLYKTVNDDDLEFRYTYAIESSTAAIPYVDANFRYNTTSTERMMVRFRLDQAELRYHNGTAWSATHTNTGVDSTAGVKYAVRVEVSGANVKVWRRPASGGAETLIFSRTDAPTYNGDRLRFNAAVDTVISLDDIMILAGDSGLSRTTTLTYRANNEIDTAADYNGTASYTFDAWGRMSTESKNSVTRTYSWTNANLLAGINSSDSAETDVTYAYTGDLKRGWRLENGSLANYYTWDAGFNVIGEEAVGEPRKTFVPGLAEVSGNDLDTSADFRFLTTDHLGSTRGMWNGSIAQTGKWEFTPYGSPYNFAGPPDVTQLFAGMDMDRISGDYYTFYRSFSPTIARWSNKDPLGMIDGPNMYSYVVNNPANFNDPLGLMTAVQCLELYLARTTVISAAYWAGMATDPSKEPLLTRLLDQRTDAAYDKYQECLASAKPTNPSNKTTPARPRPNLRLLPKPSPPAAPKPMPFGLRCTAFFAALLFSTDAGAPGCDWNDSGAGTCPVEGCTVCKK